MKPLIDIIGASGSAYRFRLAEAPGETLPVIAGNFIIVRPAQPADEVLCCGTAGTLVRAAAAWRRAKDVAPESHLYVRLNVSSKTRLAEHADIVAATAPREVLTELN